MQTTYFIKTIWLTGAFALAAAIGFLNSQTGSTVIDDPTLVKSIQASPAVLEPAEQEASEQERSKKETAEDAIQPTETLDETPQDGTAEPFVHSKAILKQACQSCHRINPKQAGQKSPHYLDLTHSSKQPHKNPVDTSFLGIHASDVQASLRKHLQLEPEIGAIVEKVIDESPAYHCGIEEHDVVVAIDQQPVMGEKNLLEKVRSRKPGTKILIEFIRQGQKESCNVVLGKQQTAQILGSSRIKGCPALLNSTTNCKDCHKTETN